MSKKKTDPTASDQISAFLRFLRDVDSTVSIAITEQEEAENETQDILHELELQRNTYHENALLAKALTDSRKKRRRAKDSCEILDPILRWKQQNQNAIRALDKALGETRTQERNHHGRHYNQKTKIVENIKVKQNE